VVLHDHDRDFVIATDATDRLDELLDLGMGQTCRRLVEQQKLGPREQCTAQLDALVQTVGQFVRALIRGPPQAMPIEQLERFGPQVAL
jgi:hypothetical protein